MVLSFLVPLALAPAVQAQTSETHDRGSEKPGAALPPGTQGAPVPTATPNRDSAPPERTASPSDRTSRDNAGPANSTPLSGVPPTSGTGGSTGH